MNIEHLESFVTLANVLNYTKAAEALFIAQPTLTRHIKNLEEHISCKLFDRSTHQVMLTEEGESFLKDATKMLLTYRRSMQNLKDFRKAEKPNLRVGYLRGGTQHIISDLFRAFYQAQCDVDITFYDGNHHEILDALKSGSHDICFSMATTLANDKDISLIPLKPLRTMLVVREDHPLANRKRVSFPDFRDEPYICVEKRITKAWFDFITSYFIGHGAMPRFSGDCTSVTSLLLMVDVGMGITILTDGGKNVIPPSLRMIPIEDIGSPYNTIGYLETNTNPALTIFLSWFQENRGEFT